MAFFERKDDYAYIRWAQEVKRRDHYTCAICGRKGVMLNSHHLNSWANYPTQRYDVENGTTLCSMCHDHFHEVFGKGKNTVEQFKEFEKIMAVIIKLANDEAIVNLAVRKVLQDAEKEETLAKILEDLESPKADQ